MRQRKSKKNKKRDDIRKVLYKGYDKTYDFTKFKTIRVFVNNIRNNFINMNLTNNEQNHFAKYIQQFKSETRPQDSNMKKVKEYVLALAMTLIKEKKMVFKAFESRVFRIHSSSNDKYTLINTSNNSISSDIKSQLFTPIKNELDLKQ